MTYYVVVVVGCIECMYHSKIIGIFTDKEEADKIRLKYHTRCVNKQFEAYIFEVNELNKDLEMDKE